jgi:hypothetical protein
MSATKPTSKNDFADKQADEKQTDRADDAALDEAAKESFPASDPPAFTGTSASPSNKCASGQAPDTTVDQKPK